MFTLHVLKSETSGNIYIGQTINLENRLKRHNGSLKSNSTSYTKINKGPWSVIYTESYETRNEAISREKELKSAKGREFIKKYTGAVAQW